MTAEESYVPRLAAGQDQTQTDSSQGLSSSTATPRFSAAMLLQHLPDPDSDAVGWTVAIAEALAAHPCCASSAASVAPIALCSALLSSSMLPMLLIVAATVPAGGPSAKDSSGPLAEELRAALSEYVAAVVLPPVEADAGIFQPAQVMTQQEACLASDSGTGQAAGSLRAERRGVVTLVLQCLSALRSCYLAARVSIGTKATRSQTDAATQQAVHVASWATEFWLDLDYLQVCGPVSGCICSHLSDVLGLADVPAAPSCGKKE
jgi:hypothetical protein